MVLTLSRQQRSELIELARQAGSFECCGLLLGRDDTVEAIEPTANVAADLATGFEIDPSALIAAEKRARRGGPQILGYYHSHPNGRTGPSAEDLRMAAADGRYWLIIADGHISAWMPIGGKDGSPKFFAAVSFDEG